MNETLLETQTETKPMNSESKTGSSLWNDPHITARVQQAHDDWLTKRPDAGRVEWGRIFKADPGLKELLQFRHHHDYLNFLTWIRTHIDRSKYKGKIDARSKKRPQVRPRRNEAVAAIASILKEEKENHEDIPFVDNKGIVCLRLPSSMTIGQMVKLGLRPSLGAIHAPIPDGMVVHVPKHYPNQ